MVSPTLTRHPVRRQLRAASCGWVRGRRTVRGCDAVWQSAAPITTQLKRLLAERGPSYRALAALTREHDPRGRGYLVGLASGAEYPSCRSLELIAASLGLDPAVFTEHRIAALRDQLEGRRVGL